MREGEVDICFLHKLLHTWENRCISLAIKGRGCSLPIGGSGSITHLSPPVNACTRQFVLLLHKIKRDTYRWEPLLLFRKRKRKERGEREESKKKTHRDLINKWDLDI